MAETGELLHNDSVHTLAMRMSKTLYLYLIDLFSYNMFPVFSTSLKLCSFNLFILFAGASKARASD